MSRAPRRAQRCGRPCRQPGGQGQGSGRATKGDGDPQPGQVRELEKLSQTHRDGPLWLFLVGSGVRLAEALGARWSDLDQDAGQLSIRRQLRRQDGAYSLEELKTKGSRRTLHLTAIASDALERQREQQAAERSTADKKSTPRRGVWRDDEVSSLLIFRTERGAPMSGSAITHRFRAALTPTRLPSIRIHDLRHTYATLGPGERRACAGGLASAGSLQADRDPGRLRPQLGRGSEGTGGRDGSGAWAGSQTPR